jgi:hypothetical protein
MCYLNREYTYETKHVYHIRQEEGPGINELAVQSTPFLSISPNPVHQTCKLSFYLDRSSEVQITLYDVLGRKVKDILNNRISQGSHTVYFNRAGSPAGVYFLQYHATGKNERAKIVIVNR